MLTWNLMNMPDIESDTWVLGCDPIQSKVQLSLSDFFSWSSTRHSTMHSNKRTQDKRMEECAQVKQNRLQASGMKRVVNSFLSSKCN